MLAATLLKMPLWLLPDNKRYNLFYRYLPFPHIISFIEMANIINLLSISFNSLYGPIISSINIHLIN